MMSVFKHEMSDRKTVSLKMSEIDHETLCFQSDVSGLGNSKMVHLLMEAMRLRSYVAVEEDRHPVWQFPSSVEAYLWLVAFDCGLVTADEVASAAWYAKEMAPSQSFKDRLEPLSDLMNRRFRERAKELEFPAAIVHEWTGG